MTQKNAPDTEVTSSNLNPTRIRRFKDRGKEKPSSEKPDQEPTNANASPALKTRHQKFRQKRRFQFMRKPSSDGMFASDQSQPNLQH